MILNPCFDANTTLKGTIKIHDRKTCLNWRKQEQTKFNELVMRNWSAVANWNGSGWNTSDCQVCKIWPFRIEQSQTEASWTENISLKRLDRKVSDWKVLT